MSRFSNYLHSMYVWTIALLLLMAIIESASRGFPTNLSIAIISAAVLDLLIKKIALKRRLTIPFSAIISGIIIGSIVPFNAPVSVVVLASALALLSKFLIRWDGHVFNPATLGLLVALSLFSLGDEWWAAGASINVAGVAMTLTPLLILASYKAGKLSTSVTFLVVIGMLSHITGIVTLNSLNAADIIRFFDGLPYYFGFIMVAEPRTSPYARKEQMVFGSGVAILSVLLTLYSSFYSLFAALLMWNLVYAIYRNRASNKYAK